MNDWLTLWHQAAVTTAGLFWMAFWAFALGYLVSSMIQVFVSRERMQRSMGRAGPRSVVIGSTFGFLSSSCSFAALATTRTLFAKGAGLVPSLAFLLASTNLVVELGIVIAVFLGWQFVVGEYAGGVLLILLMWLVVRVTAPRRLVESARRRARGDDGGGEGDVPDWRRLIASREGWRRVANRYVMEWRMVWKDVTVGFTVAGIIAVFVPRSFFESLFVGSGNASLTFSDVLLQSLVAPLAAFFTFIGSMGNIPLAAVLYENGVSFAGIMAFIFSDLVVLPVLRIQAKYYGWKMALYVLGVFLVILVATALMLHYGFAALGWLPDGQAVATVTDREFFALDYTLFLNVLFVLASVVFIAWKWRAFGFMSGSADPVERVLLWLAVLSFGWLAGGLLVPVFTA